jgi:cobalamin biosynthesis Mg chelatase CobN
MPGQNQPVRDALFGPDGTQAPPAPGTYPDALTPHIELRARARARMRVAEPVPPPKPDEPAQKTTGGSGKPRRQRSQSQSRSPSRSQSQSREPAYAQRPGGSQLPGQSGQVSPRPASPESAPQSDTSRAGQIVGFLVALLFFGALAFGILLSLLQEFGLMRP